MFVQNDFKEIIFQDTFRTCYSGFGKTQANGFGRKFQSHETKRRSP